ncbi:MAG: alpha/beta fold hydrolase, partial [Mycobacterium sp.]
PATLGGGRPSGRPGPHQHKSPKVTVTTRDGIQLAVRDYRPQSMGHTVVLLHGLCVSDAVWLRQIDYLNRLHGKNIRVISYDHRGHGRSSRASVDTYRIDQLASDLADVLTALDVGDPLTLVGHSMGGMTALAYLARSSADRPVDPQGLVLAATTAGQLVQRGLGRLLATPGAGALLTLVDHLPKQALDALAGPVCSTLSRIWPAQRAMLATVRNRIANTSVPTAAGFLPTLRSYDQYETLDGIRANTVIVSGGTDPLTPASHSQELASAIPGAAHVHLPHAGHMLPREVPDVINHAIRQAMHPDGSEPFANSNHDICTNTTPLKMGA